MIDHQRKIIFLHIGKTAGTSIEHLLLGGIPNPDVMNREIMFGWDPEQRLYLQHASAETVRRMCGDELFDNFFKFSIVRNPYSRLLSVYHYLPIDRREKLGSFDAFIKELPALLEQAHFQKGSHYLPQVAYTHLEGVEICNYIGKFEELPLSMEPVRARFGIQTALAKHNTRRTSDWSKRSVASYYSRETRAIIRDLYAEDFSRFDYPEDPRAIPYSFWKTRVKSPLKQALKPLVPSQLRALRRKLRA